MNRAEESVPVSVVIPTIGRAAPLARCLSSLARCHPPAAEIVVADQSGSEEVARVVSQFADAGARLVACDGRGVSNSRNVGLRSAANDIVMVVDDDCTVEPDWVDVGWRSIDGQSNTIVTGRVLPVGDQESVPSTIVDPEPRDYTGELRGGILFGGNMALNRHEVLAAGAFDERFSPEEAAEDNDFCYRWLKAGHRLLYEPTMTIHHHDWRTPDELRELYLRYTRGEGFFYAKHLRQGDLRMLRFIARDVYWGLRSLAAAAVKGREDWTDFRRSILRGMPVGLWRGWRALRPTDPRYLSPGASTPPERGAEESERSSS
jgi:GT2 family glycosyltransferase